MAHALRCSVCDAAWNSGARYCGACGWPGASFSVPKVQGEAGDILRPLPDRPTTVTLRFENEGVAPGGLRVTLPEGDWCAFRGLPREVRKREAGDVLPGDHWDLEIVIDLTRRAGPGPLRLTVESMDAKGQSDERGWPTEQAWRTWPWEIPIEARAPGVLSVFPDLLLFSPRVREHRLSIANEGETPIRVRVQGVPSWLTIGEVMTSCTRAEHAGPGGIEVSEAVLDITPVDLQEGIEIAGHQRVVALVEHRGETRPPDAGELRVECLTDGAERKVQLVSLWSLEYVPPGGSSYSFGVDFGTYQCSVHWVNTLGDDPNEWKPHAIDFGDGSPYLPSRVLVRWDGQMTVGRDPGYGVRPADERLVESIKLLLRDDEPLFSGLEGRAEIRPTDIVAEVLRYIATRIRNSEEFDNYRAIPGTVTCTVPVLATPEEHKRQADNTRKAAEMAGLAYLVESGLEVGDESHCAAFDFLHSGPKYDFRPEEGDIVLVFDCGAGTTDLSLLRVEYTGEGRPRLQLIASQGYEFGGSDVDAHLIEKFWERTQVSLPDHEAHVVDAQGTVWFWAGTHEEWEADQKQWTSTSLPQEGDNRRVMLDNPRLVNLNEPLLTVAREAKEDPDNRRTPMLELDAVMKRLGAKGASAAGIPGAEVRAWIDSFLRSSLRQLLHDGGGCACSRRRRPVPFEDYRDAERPAPPFSQVLAAERVSPLDIKWVCCTGGTCLVPAVKDCLQQAFLNARVIVPGKEDIMLNVSRGASLSRSFRIAHGLPFNVELWVDGKRRPDQHGLRRGTAPGMHGDPYVVRIPPAGSSRVEVRAGVDTDTVSASGCLMSVLEFGGQQNTRNLEFQVFYRALDSGAELVLRSRDLDDGSTGAHEEVCRVH